MKSYNSFTPKQRMKAYDWLMVEYAAGRRVRPTICDACGQKEGLIEPHSEDYSGPPFGDHIGQYGVCFTCHMMIHCRFRSPEAWHNYREAVRGGEIFAPIRVRAFNQFTRAFLSAKGLPDPEWVGAGVESTILDEIEAAARPQSF
jgi:hypothetical protein